MIRSLFENIELEICKEIEACKNKIDIAVAWLTNQGIINLLRNKAEHCDLEIRIIINDDKINNTQINQYKALQSAGVKIYKHSSSQLMHNKFAILDESKVITGSYNWTRAATNNIENVVITTDKDLAHKYQTEFERLLDKSHLIGSAEVNVPINTYLEQLDEESIWKMLECFHSIEYNPSAHRIFKTICGTKSNIALKTKDLPFYNTISDYKSPTRILTDLKLFFETNQKIIEEQFRYEERGWNNIDFPGLKQYNHLLESEIYNSPPAKHLNAGKKWTESEIMTLSNYLLKTNNVSLLSQLLNRSEQSIIKKAKRILFENSLLYEQWIKIKTI
jgi:hypothetical protein